MANRLMEDGKGLDIIPPPADVEKSAQPHNPSALTSQQIAAFRALSPERPRAEKARRELQTILETALERQGRRVVAAVRRALETLSKADAPDQPPPLGAVAADRITRVAVDALGDWDFVIDDAARVLGELALDSARQAVAVLGPVLEDDLVDQVNERAVRAAAERGAELVGRRVLPDGSIIDNPNPRWAITQSTRDMIRQDMTRILASNEGSDAFIRELEQTHTFSPARAEMVSRTEIADVNSRSQMEVYEEAAAAGVDVDKEWILGPEPCEICQANADQGPIPLDEDFESGDDTAPAHPNCVCAVIPVVRD